MAHQHTAQRSTEERCYAGSVAGPCGDENQAAHGGITYREVCACGADRGVNVNGRHVETGPWSAPVASFVGVVGSGRGFRVWASVDGRFIRAVAVRYDGFAWRELGEVAHVPAAALFMLGVSL